MSIKIGDALLKLGVDSTELDAGMKKATDNIKGQMKAVGAAMTTFGVATVGALTLATKSALEEEIGIRRLTTTLNNVGVAYSEVRAELEANIATIQKKTSYGDEAQRDALNDLITITGDYQSSLDLLRISMDMATAKQMDLSSAAMLVGRAVIGDTTLLKRYGIVVAEGASATEVLATMTARFGGAAEAAANPLTQLKNIWGDFSQDIGNQIRPAIENLLNGVVAMITKVREWINEHPVLTKQVVILAGVLGTFAAVLGPILVMLPMLVISFSLLAGPIGIVIAAVMALITGITLLWLDRKSVV